MNREEPMTLMKLPNDLVLNCLARVSRMQYHTLSLVSKRFCSLLASTELYQTRTLLGCTEKFLYVCLKHPSHGSRECWFIICLSTPNNSSKKVLVPITSPNYPYKYQSDVARVGSNIYSIGGSMSQDEASSKVMVMDCHSHTWREAPSMLVARESPSVCVVDEKIYVTGGCKNLDADNWMEVFDTKTQTWEFKFCGNSEKVLCSSRCQSFGYEGTVYVKVKEVNDKKVYVKNYKLHKGRWRAGDLSLSWGSLWESSAYCKIGNVLYSCTSDGILVWYNSEIKGWKYLKGLERSFGSQFKATKLADSGGKLAVLWEGDVFVETKIWCGEIAINIVKRQQKQTEIWGKLEWSDIVSTPDHALDVVRLLALTL